MTHINIVTLTLVVAAALAGFFHAPFLWSTVNLALLATMFGLILSRANFKNLVFAQVGKIAAVTLAVHIALGTAVYLLAELLRKLIAGGTGLIS